jgi:hypothetical protein
LVRFFANPALPGWATSVPRFALGLFEIENLGISRSGLDYSASSHLLIRSGRLCGSEECFFDLFSRR